jgi:histidinol dehydrogenase
LIIKRLDSSDSEFQLELGKLLAWESVSDDAVFTTVNEILRAVKSHGDSALLEYSRRFDGLDLDSAASLEMPVERLQQAYREIPAAQRDALEQAAQRIRAYAEHQKLEPWPSIRSWSPGSIPRRMVRCSGSRLPRLIGLDFTCLAARRLIRRRC